MVSGQLRAQQGGAEGADEPRPPPSARRLVSRGGGLRRPRVQELCEQDARRRRRDSPGAAAGRADRRSACASTSSTTSRARFAPPASRAARCRRPSSCRSPDGDNAAPRREAVRPPDIFFTLPGTVLSPGSPKRPTEREGLMPRCPFGGLAGGRPRRCSSASSALAQTGQINGVLTDNTGSVIPGASVKAVETATGLSRDTVSGADGRYVHVAAADHLRHHRGARRVPDDAAQGHRAASQREPDREFRARARQPRRNAHRHRAVADGRRHLVGAQRSRRSETDRRAAAERPRRRQAEHAGRRGWCCTAVDQESGRRFRARCGCRPTAPRRARCRSVSTAPAIPIRNFQQNQPFPFPDALQEFSIQTSNYSAAQGNSAGAVVNAVTRSGTNDFHGGALRLPARSHVQRAEFLLAGKRLPQAPAVRRLRRRPDSAQQDVLLRRLAGHRPPERGHDQDRDGADGRAARRQLRQRRRPGSADRPAVPEQPDSGEPVRSVVGRAAEVHPGARRRRPHPDSAADRAAGQPDRHQARSDVRPEGPADGARTSSTTSTTIRPTPKATC